MLNKVLGQLLIVVDNKVISKDVVDWDEATADIEDYLKDNPHQKDERIDVYQYVSAVDSLSHFTVNEKPGALVLEDENLSNHEYSYEITDGEFRGQEFVDSDELQEFLNEKLQQGWVSLEDVQKMGIHRTLTEDATFPDAYTEDTEYEVSINGGVASSIVENFGEVFVLASEAEDKPEKVMAQEDSSIAYMSTDDLQLELLNLLNRASEIQKELRTRPDRK